MERTELLDRLHEAVSGMDDQQLAALVSRATTAAFGKDEAASDAEGLEQLLIAARDAQESYWDSLRDIEGHLEIDLDEIMDDADMVVSYDAEALMELAKVNKEDTEMEPTA